MKPFLFGVMAFGVNSLGYWLAGYDFSSRGTQAVCWFVSSLACGIGCWAIAAMKPHVNNEVDRRCDCGKVCRAKLSGTGKHLGLVCEEHGLQRIVKS